MLILPRCSIRIQDMREMFKNANVSQQQSCVGVAQCGAGGALHRPNVYITDFPRDDSVAPEQLQRLVVQRHEQDDALGYSSYQPEMPRRAIEGASRHRV
jgi:hypothetical protein